MNSKLPCNRLLVNQGEGQDRKEGAINLLSQPLLECQLGQARHMVLRVQ
jgi:hypothetical protein